LAALKFFLGYALDRLHTARTSHHSVETMQDLPHRAGENRIFYPPSSSHRAQLIRLDERAADAEFAAAYGYDVTDWTGLALLRDIREMRTTCMAAQAAANRLAWTKRVCGWTPCAAVAVRGPGRDGKRFRRPVWSGERWSTRSTQSHGWTVVGR
jgi:hypothetical protein